MALMSWCLWLLGAVDKAAARVAEAISRAEAIGHSHSLAYACYYASFSMPCEASHPLR